MDKECFACSHYKPYYTKGYCTFDKKDFGECRITGAQMDKHHPHCDKFARKLYLKHNYDFVIKKLEETFKTLNTLLETLKNDREAWERLNDKK